MNNIALGADGRANHVISVLRATKRNGQLAHEVSFVPGLALHVAPELEISGQWRSEEAEIFDLEATISGQGGWVGLHLDLPFESILPYGVLGIVARTSGPAEAVARVCLRSGKKDGFEDNFFEKPMIFSPQDASHLDVIELNRLSEVPERAPWRELILFLPSRSFHLRLIDLRVFLV